MKTLLVLAGVLFLVGCNNLNRRPERWALVLDADTNKPIPHFPLVYTELAKPYFIVSYPIQSQEYISDENGLAKVPSKVVMHPHGWGLGPRTLREYSRVDGELSKIDIHGKKDVEVIYVREEPPFVLEKLPDMAEEDTSQESAPKWHDEMALAEYFSE